MCFLFESLNRRVRNEWMNKLCIFVGMVLVGYVGWWLGDKMGMIYAFALGSFGNLLGIYVGWKINKDCLS